MRQFVLVCLIMIVTGFAPTATAYEEPGVHVGLTATQLQIGEELVVAVRVVNPDDGCLHPIMDITLVQPDNSPLRLDSDAKLGPPAPNPAIYRLTAVTTGTVTLQAVAFGEQNCGNGWQWEYRSGRSAEITVIEPPVQAPEQPIYLPLLTTP